MDNSFFGETSTRDRREFLRVPTNCEVVARKIHYATDGIVQMWGEVKSPTKSAFEYLASRTTPTTSTGSS